MKRFILSQILNSTHQIKLTNFKQLSSHTDHSASLSEGIRGKMYLTHYQDFNGNDCDWDKLAKDAGFAEFLSIG
jgi:hypothetical protein